VESVSKLSAEALAALEEMEEEVREFPRMSPLGGTEEPQRKRRLSDSYFRIQGDEWNRDYRMGRYAEDVVALLDSLGIQKMRWVGTSMGGALGILLAGTVLRDRITHLVLNDIGAGPVSEADTTTGVQREGYERIMSYVANPPEFDTLTGLMEYYRTVYSTFGIEREEEWIAFAETSVRRKDNGKFTPAYDPRIVSQLKYPQDMNLWHAWDAIRAKVLLIRGERSDILPIDTAQAMQQRGPGCKLVTIPNVGHAPHLNTEYQISIVSEFLAS
jgi:pimeloyl-ACP methyl ester carboxylesterase